VVEKKPMNVGWRSKSSENRSDGGGVAPLGQFLGGDDFHHDWSLSEHSIRLSRRLLVFFTSGKLVPQASIPRGSTAWLARSPPSALVWVHVQTAGRALLVSKQPSAAGRSEPADPCPMSFSVLVAPFASVRKRRLIVRQEMNC